MPRLPPSTQINFESGHVQSSVIASRRRAQKDLKRIKLPYPGSKRGIIVDIHGTLDEAGVDFSSVIDMFSGSGVVSLYFKLVGKRVWSNELLTSSHLNSRCFVENGTINISQEDLDDLCSYEGSSSSGFVKEYWGDRFLPEEIDILDRYRANVESLSGIKRDQALLAMCHYVLNNCYLGGRLNKGQVIANIKHRLEHIRNQKTDRMMFNVPPPPFFPGDEVHLTTNADALTTINQHKDKLKQFDLCYLDPPYGQSQSDYAEMFRFCEEYVHQKRIEEISHLNESGAKDRFSKSKGYESQFRAIISSLHDIPTLVISYNADSFAASEKIQSILRDYRSDVLQIDIDHKYKYRKDKGSSTEYLFIAR